MSHPGAMQSPSGLPMPANSDADVDAYLAPPKTTWQQAKGLLGEAVTEGTDYINAGGDQRQPFAAPPVPVSQPTLAPAAPTPAAGVPSFNYKTAPGMIEPGNLDPWNRPVLHNPDGSYSTTSSISIGTDKGETLIPTVVNGVRLSNADAIAHYKKTGENLGTFANAAQADTFATDLHNAQAAKYDQHGIPANATDADIDAYLKPPTTVGDYLHAPLDVAAAAYADLRRHISDNQPPGNPAMDHYLATTEPGKLLATMGRGTLSIWNRLTRNPDDPEDLGSFLQKAGLFDSYDSKVAGTTRAFNQAVMTPSAMALDAFTKAKAAEGAGYTYDLFKNTIEGSWGALKDDFIGRVSPEYQKAWGNASFWGRQKMDFEQLMREGKTPMDAFMAALSVTGVPEAFTAFSQLYGKGVAAVLPPVPGMPDIEKSATENMETALSLAMPARGAAAASAVHDTFQRAKNLGIIGEPADPAAQAAAIKKQAAYEQEFDKEHHIPTDKTAPEQAATRAPPEPLDIHQTARSIDPVTFEQYDPLKQRHDILNRKLLEDRAERARDPRLQAAQDAIDRIMDKVDGVEARLTNRQRDQIADIRGGMQDFLADEEPLLHVKQAIAENYQEMADLAPQVRAAYRAAEERMAQTSAEGGEAQPAAAAPPAAAPEAAQAVPTSDAARAETPEVQQRNDADATRIADDIYKKLVKAGWPKDQASDFASTHAAYFVQRARRFGYATGTPYELYAQEGPNIYGPGREIPANQPTFAQKAITKAMDIAKQVPGLRQIMPDLTAEDRDTLTKRLGANLVKVFAKVPFGAEEMASVAYSGRAKRGWYRDAAQAIHQLFGPADADRFTALLAAQSPQTSVESNLYNSLRTWVNWDKEGRPTDHATIKRIIGQSVEGTGGEASTLDAWVNNSIRALTHPDPAKLDISGPKVSSFMKNLRGNVDEVTNDAWMATYAALDPEFFKGAKIKGSPHAMGMGFYGKSTGYRAVSAMARRAAKILTERTGDTWTPAEVQETVWSWTKALYERRDRAGEDRTTQQILKAGDLTHEDVAGASDFASLLVRGIYSKILEEGGYGEELEGIRQSADERAAANRPTGPAVSVTSAEGSGIAQPAFERHLQSAAKRIEGVRTERIAESYNPTRDMAKKAAKSEIAANLSAVTPSIPGIQQLADAANKGDVSAGHLVNLIAHDSLTRLMSGIPGVELETTSNGGLYGGTLEPSLGVNVKFHEKQRGPVLAALAKFAENFNQEQVHVRQPTIDEVGRVSTDGSYATPVYRIHLKTPLTRDEIQHHIDTSGLYGLTFNDKMVEAYHVAIDPRSNKELEAFLANVEKLKTSLGENGGRFQQKVERLWAYGRGDGATAGYDAIAGELPAGKEQHTQVPRALAERELGHEVTPAEQAAEITPEQRALQERIAGHFEDIPENDLDNPLVIRSYTAAVKVVDRQLQTVPIKYEAWADQQPDGSWVARGGEPYRNSNAMRADVLHNNHMWFYITDKDQFGPPGQAFTGHPLLENSGFKSANGYPMLQNDVFRVVHDYYAHLTSPVSFGPKGEEAAWRNHMATIDDPWARWALTSETRGQNSWVNFRPGVDEAMPLGDRGFAPQKAALLPIEDTLSGDDYVDLPMLELQRELTPAQARGSLPDEMHFQSAGPEGEGIRGAIAIGKGVRASIYRTRLSDASTYLHEMYHDFLQALKRDAAHPQAPADIIADYKTVRDSYNSTAEGRKYPWTGDTIPERAHEWFARGGERHAMEGAVPSEALRPVFQRFKEWFTEIYKTVGRLKAPISPAMREVYNNFYSFPEERPVVASPRIRKNTIGEEHEATNVRTEPKMAAVAADKIREQQEERAENAAPKVHQKFKTDTIEIPTGTGQAGGVAAPHAYPAGGANAAGSLAADAGDLEGHGAVPAGGNQAAQEGAELGGAAGPGGGPAAGEPGAAAAGAVPPGAGERGAGGVGGLREVQGTGEVHPRRVAQRSEENAIAAGLSQAWGNAPEYAQLNRADQIKGAVRFMNDDWDAAVSAALGRTNPPADLHPESIFIAVENRALAKGDIDLLQQLARESTLVKEGTIMGQRISMWAERNPSSPVAMIQKLQIARDAAAKPRAGEAAAAKVEQAPKLKEALKNALPNAAELKAFLDDIRCT